MTNIVQAVAASARRKALEQASSGANDIANAVSSALDELFERPNEFANLPDEAELHLAVSQQLNGLGVLQPLLDDPTIEEIWINAPDQIFVATSTSTERLELDLSQSEIKSLIERMLKDTGRRLDRSVPFVDASLADGSRLHVVIPDVTRENWSINIRKFNAKILSLSDLVELGSLTIWQSEFLRQQVRLGRNILVSGATQAGKTTLLCALLSALDAKQRVVSVEETFEIRVAGDDWVAMQTRQPNLEGVGEATLRRLVKEALRMRPSRLVVGEVREAESLDLLIALNSGLPGMSTIHANSARDAVAKLCTLPLLAGQNISSSFVNPTVGNCIDLVVHCQYDEETRQRKAIELVAVSWNPQSQQIEFSNIQDWVKS